MQQSPITPTTLGRADDDVGSAIVDAHARSVEEVAAATGSGLAGLTSTAAADRGRRWGANRSEPEQGESLTSALAESLTEPLQLLLVAVGVLSALWGELRDAVAIFAIIGVVATVEAGTEARARRAVEGLRSLTAPTARVRRDGSWSVLPAAELVVGDLVALARGDVVAADCRVVTASGLAVDESALTGEPAAVFKADGPVPIDAPLAERASIVWAGTAVLGGDGRGLVVATGAATELGGLGAMVTAEREPATPLQRTMAELARAILVAAVLASVAVPLLGVAAGRPVREMVLAGLALAFATIPEELPILVTVLLAVGGRRLAGRGALLRRLRAAETLGAVTVVVTDKTGTLTENRLRVDRVEGEPRAVLAVATACLDAVSASTVAGGDPLQAALADAATAAGLPRGGEPVARFPFDPVRKRMSALVRDADRLVVAVQGAPEAVLGRCALPQGDRAAALGRAGDLASRGLRVLAFADRDADEPPTDADDAERDLRYRGLVAFSDPLRDGVPAAVATLAGAGVATIMVTGDHPSTAAAIAHAAGVIRAGAVVGSGAVAASSAMTGSALSELDDAALAGSRSSRARRQGTSCGSCVRCRPPARSSPSPATG